MSVFSMAVDATLQCFVADEELAQVRERHLEVAIKVKKQDQVLQSALCHRKDPS